VIPADNRTQSVQPQRLLATPDQNADTSCGLKVDGGYVELATEVFAMLADSTRVQLILALHDNEMSVSDLASAVGKPQPVVSQHLAKMRMARMVSRRHEGTRVYYRMEDEHARQLVADAIFQAEHSVVSKPRHHTCTDTGAA
jgi:DNA-binding transcriptional ArsR family regulator